jgi:hypothetical protein
MILEVNNAEELTYLQQQEREAMCGDRAAILVVVSAVRQFRALIHRLGNSRYSDGECDGYSLTTFFDEVAEIENQEPDDD